MPARMLAGAMCVQRFDDSLNSAIHITYRISLRSSSMPEPRDPLLKVLTCLSNTQRGLQRQWFGCLRRACDGAPRWGAGPPKQLLRGSVRDGLWESCNSLMIPPLVHQRRPCYDFYFL